MMKLHEHLAPPDMTQNPTSDRIELRYYRAIPVV